MATKLNELRGDDGFLAGYSFVCPGCSNEYAWRHVFYVAHQDGSQKPIWSFNGNMESPTFTPSLLNRGEQDGKATVCHLFLTDGMLHFLSDCTHKLAGQTVPMELDLTPEEVLAGQTVTMEIQPTDEECQRAIDQSNEGHD